MKTQIIIEQKKMQLRRVAGSVYKTLHMFNYLKLQIRNTSEVQSLSLSCPMLTPTIYIQLKNNLKGVLRFST